MTSLNLDHIINWKLKHGSHKFPGPDGGTCINEAAIVAAGFEYRAVSSWQDCPPCFSPVLSQFAIFVNDSLEDRDRQDLMMPLVTRLAGSRDEEPWVEEARARFILDSATRQLIAPVLKYVPQQIDRYRRSTYLDLDPVTGRTTHPDEIMGLIKRADRAIEEAGCPDMVPHLAHALAGAYRLLRIVREIRWIPAREYLISPNWASADSPGTQEIVYERLSDRDFWPRCATILTRAFRIGTQAPAADTAKVVERMEAAKVLAATNA